MSITHVQLGGELTGRSLFGGNRNRLEWIGMIGSIAVLFVAQLLMMQWAWTIALTAVLMTASVFVWTPRATFNHCSLMGLIGIRLRYQWHRRQGLLDHAGGAEAEVPLPEARTKKERKKIKPLPHAPAAMGQMRFFEIDLYPGQKDPGRVLIIRHRNHDQVTFNACFEFRTRQAGVVESSEGLRNHTGWSKFESALARSNSLVRYLQQVSRVVPFDPADHVHWLIGELPDDTPELLVQSYAQLVDGIISDLEQNRTWLTVGIPATSAFYAAAERLPLDLSGQDLTREETANRRIEAVLAAQLRTVVSRGKSNGMAFRPLSEQRFGAVCRSLQDPDDPLDRLEGADRYSMWMPWIGSEDRQYLRVKGKQRDWFTRTALVPRDGFAPGQLPVDLLVPLLTGVSPAVIRTVSTHMTLVPATTAREEARQDVTVDRSNLQGKANQVSDGTGEVQVGISQQRLADLKPGSGIQGAEWAMAITIQAASLDELESATNRIEEAAADCNISVLSWQDSAQHLALPLTLPLGTGVRRRKKGVLAA